MKQITYFLITTVLCVVCTALNGDETPAADGPVVCDAPCLEGVCNGDADCVVEDPCCEGVASCGGPPDIDLNEGCCPCDDRGEPLHNKVNKWTGFFSLGFSNLQGNKNETVWNGEVDATRQTTVDGCDVYMIDLEGKFKYRTTSGTTKTDQGRLRGLFEYNLTQKWVWRWSEELYWDISEDIDMRVETCTDIGYYIWKSKELTLEPYLGVAHAEIHYSKLNPSQQAQGLIQKRDSKNFYYDSGWDFKWKVWEWLTFIHEFQYSPRMNSLSHFWLESFVRFEIPIAKHWKILLEQDYYYDTDPSPNILNWDVTYEVKLAYTF